MRSRLMDVTTLSAAVSTRRLLVVEDDDSIRETVGEALRAEGLEVQTCADGPSALNLITAETSDPVGLIVLDLMLPGLEGLDLHGGRIEARNHPAGGACMDLLLPREPLQ